MNFLSELLNINNQNDHFLVEDIGKLKDLGLGRMINAFKQSFSLSGNGSTAKLNQTSVGTKLQARSTNIGSNSQVIDVGHVRNWPHVRRELIKNLDKPGVAALMFRIDEKPVSILILGPQWSINNSKAVVGMAWDFTNVSASDIKIEQTLAVLSVKRKTAKDSGKKEEVPLRMYQGYAQEMNQAIEFIKLGVLSFGNRFNFSFITPELDVEEFEVDPKTGKTLIDKKTNKPVPKKDVKESEELTNEILDLIFEDTSAQRTKLNVSRINTVLLTPSDKGFENLKDKVYGVRNESPIIDALLELLGVPEDGTPYKIRNGFMKYEKNSKMLFIAKFKSDLPGVTLASK